MKITARYPWATEKVWAWLWSIDKRSECFLTVTSLYRPRWYNTLVRGLWNSYHLKAKAADLAPSDGDLKRLEAIARATAPVNGQVVIEAKKGIVHLEIED